MRMEAALIEDKDKPICRKSPRMGPLYGRALKAENLTSLMGFGGPRLDPNLA